MEHQDNTTPEAARERTKQEIVKHFFPFVQPPDELIQGTYIIQDERLKLQSGYHQTSTGILLTQPPSGHILIPAAEIIEKIPILETQLIFRNELPITHQLGRPFAVWWRNRPLHVQPWNESAFTPQRGEKLLDDIKQIKELYESALRGAEINKNKLAQLFDRRIAGWWWKYYVERLPKKICASTDTDKSEVRQELANLFVNVEQQVKKANHAYHSLSDEEKILLHQGFNITIHATIKNPVVYMDDDIPACMQSPSSTVRPRPYFEDNPPRSPYQIVGDPRGLTKNEIIKIYFPDEVKNTEVEQIARSKLEERGIEHNRIAYISDLTHQGVTPLETCLASYGDFSWDDLRRAIMDRWLIHIHDDEILQSWKQDK